MAEQIKQLSAGELAKLVVTNQISLVRKGRDDLRAFVDKKPAYVWNDMSDPGKEPPIVQEWYQEANLIYDALKIDSVQSRYRLRR